MPARHPISRHRGDERGAAAVEFALVSVPAILLILGAIQYGYYFYVSETASGAASTLARRLSVGDCWTGSEALTFAQGQAPTTTGVVKDPISISATTARGTPVIVTVTAEASIIGFFPVPNGGTVERVVTTRLEDQTAGTC